MGKLKKIGAGLLLTGMLASHATYAFDDTSLLENPTLEQKQMVADEVLKLQNNIFTSSKNLIETLTQEFNKVAQYEETGDMELHYEYTNPYYEQSSSTGKVLVDNYEIKKSGMNSSFSGHIDMISTQTFLEDSTQEIEDEGEDVEVSSLESTGSMITASGILSFIAKDGEMYGLLKDFDFSTVNSEDAEELLQKLKTLFEDNKYVKTPTSEEQAKIFEVLKNLSAQSIIGETEKVLSQPLLQTYKVQSGSYLLVPTKYACDTYFQLDEKLHFFDSWYTPSECSDSVYKSFLKKFVKTTQIYFTPEENANRLEVVYVAPNEEVTMTMNLLYTQDSILEFDVKVVPDQDKYPEEGFSLSYEKQNALVAYFIADESNIVFSFESALDENNHFTSIHSEVDIDGDVTGTFHLQDSDFSGFYKIKEKGYDYTSDEWNYELKNIYGVKILGTLNDEKNIDTLKIKMAGVDVKDKSVFVTGKLNYEQGNYVFELTDPSDETLLNMTGEGFIGKNKFTSKFNFSGDATVISGEVDYDTLENNNNISVLVHMSVDDINVLDFSLSNIGERSYKETSIEAPVDYKELEEGFFDEPIVVQPVDEETSFDESMIQE